MTQKSIRYGQYLGAIRRHHRHISYNQVVALERALPSGSSKLRLIDIHRLLTPYVSVRFLEQCWAVIPLALMLFMEGVNRGLMPFAKKYRLFDAQPFKHRGFTRLRLPAGGRRHFCRTPRRPLDITPPCAWRRQTANSKLVTLLQ